MITGKVTTAREIVDKTTVFFTAKGIPSARLDAEILLAEVLGYDRLRLYMNLDRPLDEAELTRAREMVRRRAAKEPVAYILGRKEFAGRDFKVGPGVLVPRPDTEILVEEVGRELMARFADEPGDLRILEFGIGSGAIAITLAAEHLRAQVTATEISETAAAIARENAVTHGVSERVEILVQSDFSGIPGPFHAIVSNPPYIDPAELPTLAPDVANYEPHEALFAEDAGLRWYRFLAGEAARLLALGGFLAVEIGYTQREAVEQIFASAGLKLVRSVKDFGGNDRVILAEQITKSAP